MKGYRVPKCVPKAHSGELRGTLFLQNLRKWSLPKCMVCTVFSRHLAGCGSSLCRLHAKKTSFNIMVSTFPCLGAANGHGLASSAASAVLENKPHNHFSPTQIFMKLPRAELLPRRSRVEASDSSSIPSVVFPRGAGCQSWPRRTYGTEACPGHCH
jgi:hypothetical protein